MTVRVLVGDVFERLRELPADHFDCVVTSPPYWGLRDYGVEGQLGLEPTLAEHIETMVRVFAEVHRVLKPTGVLFLNYGDCYATSPNGRSAAETKAAGKDDRTFRDKPFSTIGPIGGAPHAQGYDSGDTAGPGSRDRGSSSGSRGGARKDTSSSRTSDSDVGRALGQARGPLSQILASMQSLIGRLPSGDCSDPIALRQSASATLDQVPAAAQALDALLAALASTTPESSSPHPEDSRLSDMTSACLSSLQSFEIGAREFVRMLGEPSETPPHMPGTVSPSEALAHCIRCTAACCSLLASWEYVEPERPVSLGGKRITSGEAREDVDVGGWGSRDDSLRWRGGGVLKPKDLCMIPNRLAIALQEWGWWVRSEIVWAKPNPMPESIKDRPATSHEKIFMLSKSSRYFYAADEVRQGAAEASLGRWAQNIDAQEGSHRANGGAKTNGTMKAVGGPRSKDLARRAQQRTGGAISGGTERSTLGFAGKTRAADYIEDTPTGSRSLRNWEPAPLPAWSIGTAPFSEAHFATFPPELVERCLRAGCPKEGRVLDPFGGAGTTALVADQMQLDATIIELNPDYVHIAIKRIEDDRGAIQNAIDPLLLFPEAADA